MKVCSGKAYITVATQLLNFTNCLRLFDSIVLSIAPLLQYLSYTCTQAVSQLSQLCYYIASPVLIFSLYVDDSYSTRNGGVSTPVSNAFCVEFSVIRTVTHLKDCGVGEIAVTLYENIHKSSHICKGFSTKRNNTETYHIMCSFILSV